MSLYDLRIARQMHLVSAIYIYIYIYDRHGTVGRRTTGKESKSNKNADSYLLLRNTILVAPPGGQSVMDQYYTGMFPVGDTSSGTLIAYVCVCVCVCVSLSADISLYCAKNDLTDYPEIVWVCWV